VARNIRLVKPVACAEVQEGAVAVATQQIDLPITGMTCANCVRTVERTLKKTEGVSDAVVNFATEKASYFRPDDHQSY
jgi:Cu+-exporting ATPase